MHFRNSVIRNRALRTALPNCTVNFSWFKPNCNLYSETKRYAFCDLGKCGIFRIVSSLFHHISYTITLLS